MFSFSKKKIKQNNAEQIRKNKINNALNNLANKRNQNLIELKNKINSYYLNNLTYKQEYADINCDEEKVFELLEEPKEEDTKEEPKEEEPIKEEQQETPNKFVRHSSSRNEILKNFILKKIKI